MASRKQIAAAKRNIKKAHAAIRKTHAKIRKKVKKAKARLPKRKKSSTRKVNKPKKRSKSVVKSRTSNILGKIPVINNPIFRKAATGIGIATLGVAVLSLILPSVARQPLVKPVLALIGGGVPGVVAQFLIQGGGGLTNILGSGNGAATNGGGTPSSGFA